LAVGLGVNSRIRSKQMELPTDLTTIIIAGISDNISNYMWSLGGAVGDAPGTLVKRLFQEETEETPKRYKSFTSEEELLNTLYKGK